jgi:transposase
VKLVRDAFSAQKIEAVGIAVEPGKESWLYSSVLRLTASQEKSMLRKAPVFHYRRCCGIDVHKETVVVHVLAPEGTRGKGVRKSFGTMHAALINLRTWLKLLKVTDIAMESTGIYWMPVWHVLEDPAFTLLLANPQQLKALQGRKSDQRDAKRIAEFLQDRRLDGSFVPPAAIRHLRILTRHRSALLHQRNEVHNQIRDLLEMTGIKLSSVASNLLGVSGQRILRALAAGEESAERLSWKAVGKLRQKEGEIKQAVRAEVGPFYRETLGFHLKHYDFLCAHLTELEGRIAKLMEPYSAEIALLVTIPGVDRLVAWQLIAELGADMAMFPDAEHCASWAGLSPGTQESAGVQYSGRTKKGNKHLRRVLTQAAWANTHRKDGYLRALFYRIKGRHDKKIAIVAVAHKILVIAYSMLKTKEVYRELGGDYFDRLNPERTVRRMIIRMAQMGYGVEIVQRPAPAVAPAPPVSPAVEEPAKRKRGRPRKYPLPENLNPEASTS